jgi:hypothetical protein
MTVTLELSSEVEAKLRESIARKDAESARRLLAEAFAPTVENLLNFEGVEELPQKSADELSDEEFEALLDQMLDETDHMIPPGTPPLSDYALSRESFYEDHP